MSLVMIHSDVLIIYYWCMKYLTNLRPRKKLSTRIWVKSFYKIHRCDVGLVSIWIQIFLDEEVFIRWSGKRLSPSCSTEVEYSIKRGLSDPWELPFKGTFLTKDHCEEYKSNPLSNRHIDSHLIEVKIRDPHRPCLLGPRVSSPIRLRSIL